MVPIGGELNGLVIYEWAWTPRRNAKTLTNGVAAIPRNTTLLRRINTDNLLLPFYRLCKFWLQNMQLWIPTWASLKVESKSRNWRQEFLGEISAQAWRDPLWCVQRIWHCMGRARSYVIHPVSSVVRTGWHLCRIVKPLKKDNHYPLSFSVGPSISLTSVNCELPEIQITTSDICCQSIVVYNNEYHERITFWIEVVIHGRW